MALSGSGAADGALKGAEYGSVVPGFGTVAGAAVGGVIGLFTGGDDDGGQKLDSNNAASGWGPDAPGYYGYGTPGLHWGQDDPYSLASQYANKGLGAMNTAMQSSAQAQNQAGYLNAAALGNRGAQAGESAALTGQYAQDKGYDQSAALQLAYESATGQAPSAAAYQMQSGLDQSLANQQAMQGSARGAAGIALAGGNAAANSANLQNQTYGQAAQLRAQEMAQAQGLYGGLSGQVVDQDLSRIGQGNQMAQYNSSLNDAWKLGLTNAATQQSQVANQYANTGLGYYTASQAPYDHNLTAQTNSANIGQQTYDSAQNRVAGMIDKEAGRAQQSADSDKAEIGTAITATGQVASAAISGAKGGK